MNLDLYKPLSIYELGKRPNQEDNMYPASGCATEKDRLFVLCDGIGGHKHGEIASTSVCKSISEYFLQQSSKSLNLKNSLATGALAYAYEKLDELAVKDGSRQMGTTLAMLYFHKQGCTVMHIGDSRIYHIRPSANTILYKSRDHSLAYELFLAGELSYEEMKNFPQKNVITRAMIAGDNNHPKADVMNITDIQSGDYFYICSDGMLELMEDDELLHILSSDKSDEDKKSLLIAATKGNADNHSAYIVHVKSVDNDILPDSRCGGIVVFGKNKKMRLVLWLVVLLCVIVAAVLVFKVWFQA